nr:winged helix-turn-helix domain-containing protein [Roseomonas acroporae]
MTEAGQEVRVGSRALAILGALLEQSGTPVGKEALIAQVWPRTHVEEINLRVHVSALRRALGDGRDGRRYLHTVSGRGYQFVGQVVVEETPTGPVAAAPASMLPLPLGRVIGRNEVIVMTMQQLRRRRFVTIVGPGGIGKTTVALAAAERLAAAFPGGVHLVDLTPIQDDGRVAAAVAAALGIARYAEDALPGILAFLRDSRVLLVLDNCERVVGGAAALAEQVLRRAPGAHILATSRERLRAEGEHMLRLPVLAVPPLSATLTAERLQDYASVQLFVERAAAANEAFRLRDEDAPVLAAICHRLDGIALAIELAAGHMAVTDLASLGALLEDRFRLTALGRRTALPRHRTLRTVIDWSYETLGDEERAVLRRLAVFEGMITLEATLAVLADDTMPRERIVASLASLVDKSLVTAEIGDAGVRYKLLDTTRAYALERLAEAGELGDAARRHAAHYLALATEVGAEWARQNTARWLIDTFAPHLGNLRAALDWAFSPRGDDDLAIGLSLAGIPLMFELAPVDEIRRRASRALDRIAALGRDLPAAALRLRAACGVAMMYNPGPVAETARCWERVLSIATTLDDVELQARACWGLWTVHVYGARPALALTYAEWWRGFGRRQGSDVKALLADRITGTALHYLGQQRQALALLEGMAERYVLYRHHWFTLGFEIDHGAMARVIAARAHWILGRPALARRAAEAGTRPVLAQGYPIGCCYVLCEAAFPVAVLVGDLAAAETALAALEGWADHNGLAIWQAAARCCRLALDGLRGRPLDADAVARALAAMRATGFTTHLSWLSGLLAETLGGQGWPEAGLQLVNAALDAAAAGDEGWCRAELLRVRAELRAWAQDIPLAGSAGEDLRDALDLARRQEANGWALRIAVSRARLARTAAERAGSLDLLAATLATFGEGEETADLLAARGLLAT